MYQLVRDTPVSSRSVLNGQSILRDLVGNDGVTGIVESTSDLGETLRFAVLAPYDAFSPQVGYYNGRTLTFLDPVVSGGNSLHSDSTRIVSYDPVTDPNSAIITGITITVEWSAGEGLVEYFPQVNSRFLINGRPFNGTGAGYVDAAPYSLEQRLPLSNTSPPPGYVLPQTALLPNYSYYTAANSIDPTIGGLDEPWDTVDYQNMFLAMVPPNATQGIIPSFHRPALVNYWLKRFAADELTGLTTAEKRAAFQNPLVDPNITPELRNRLLELKRRIILAPAARRPSKFPQQG